jgi:hypothetical protein
LACDFLFLVGASLLTRWRLVFFLGRLHRTPRDLARRQDRDDVPHLPRGVISRSRRPAADDRRLILGNVNNPHVVGKNSRGFVVGSFGGRLRFFRLDFTLNFDDLPASRIGATDVLAFELRIQLITFLTTGTNESDMHEWVPSKKSGRVPTSYSRE